MKYIELHSGTQQAYVIKTSVPHAFPDAKPISATKGKARIREAALQYLRDNLKPGDTVYCILRNVSRSGMSRQIDFYMEGMRCISGSIAEALDYPQAQHGALKVGGCGMDMGFSVVYNLGATLWPNGTPKPHGTRNGELDTDGGYALKHRWL